MAVWFGDDFEFIMIDGESCTVINQSWYILLLNNIDALLTESEVIVSLQQLDGTLMCVVRCHDAERHVESFLLSVLYKRQSSVIAC